MPSKEEINNTNISIEIAKTAVESALSSYGIEAITSPTLDYAPLPSDDAYTGVKVEKDKSSNKYSVSLYVTLSVGIKITEVLSSVQKLVLFNLSKKFNNKIKEVNVYAVGIVVNK